MSAYDKRTLYCMQGCWQLTAKADEVLTCSVKAGLLHMQYEGQAADMLTLTMRCDVCGTKVLLSDVGKEVRP